MKQTHIDYKPPDVVLNAFARVLTGSTWLVMTRNVFLIMRTPPPKGTRHVLFVFSAAAHSLAAIHQGASGAPGDRRVLRTPRIVRAAPKLAQSRHNGKPMPWNRRDGPAVGHGGANSCTQSSDASRPQHQALGAKGIMATLQARLSHPDHGGTAQAASAQSAAFAPPYRRTRPLPHHAQRHPSRRHTQMDHTRDHPTLT